MDSPDVIEQMPAGGATNAPTSGTYGEGAELERLRSDMPTGEAGAPPGAEAPTAEPYEGAGGVPEGLPPSLMLPTQQPDVPVQTPLAMPAAPPPDPTQQRILLLQHLQTSSEVSEETKELATLALNRLIRSNRA